MNGKFMELVKAALHKFYHEHHRMRKLETDLVDELKSTRVRSFTETKHNVVNALDYRISRLEESLKILHGSAAPESVRLDLESRKDELESIRSYVKGMVVRVDE